VTVSEAVAWWVTGCLRAGQKLAHSGVHSERHALREGQRGAASALDPAGVPDELLGSLDDRLYLPPQTFATLGQLAGPVRLLALAHRVENLSELRAERGGPTACRRRSRFLTCRIVCRVRVARMVRSTPVRAAQDTKGLAVLLPDGLPGPGRELMASLVSLTVLSAKVHRVMQITMHFLNWRMRRLLAAGLLPERAGQPVKALVHVSLADLMLIDGSSALMEEWSARVRAQWAAARAAASVTGSDGAAWLDGETAAAFTCDASTIPVVTGDVNLGTLEDLIRLCAELGHLHRDAAGTGQDDAPDPGAPDSGADGIARSRDALVQAIIGKAVDLLSGPGGLASFLRRRQLGARLGGPSLPLDVGVSADIPAAIRRAVILRDQHCRFPGGCDQPAAGCEVHHLRHRKDGGPTSVKDCALFCFFHHQVVIHQWGWTVVLNPDGTTTAWNKDKTKIIHSHSPPVRPG
jgi:hypothetical protein